MKRGRPDDIHPHASDEELLSLVARGRREALAVLVQRHQHNTLALAHRYLGRWEAAEDVCQEAFIRVLENARRYEPKARFSTWLYRIVVNLCLDRRRREAREVGPPPTAALDRSAEPDDTPLERRERHEQIRAAVARLPERQRMALILHRYQGMSHKEIAGVTGWSASAVESCLVRAYGRLRELLADTIGD